MSSSSPPNDGYKVMQVTISEAELEAKENPSVSSALLVMRELEPGFVFIGSPYAVKDNSGRTNPVSMALLFDERVYSKEEMYSILSRTAEGILDQIVSEEVNKTND